MGGQRGGPEVARLWGCCERMEATQRSVVSTTLSTHRGRPGSATVPAGETCDPGWKQRAHAIVDVFRKTCEWK